MKRTELKVINGENLRQMVISGANNLFNHYPEVDQLNVFPVPDGDTGTNMNLTISSGSKEIANINNENIYDVAKLFSRGLLMGARGNSGVILSQIFRGFSQGLEGKAEANIEDLCAAWEKGSKVAYRAVMKPVEGTILTVIRESTEQIIANKGSFKSINDLMDCMLKAAKVSLEHTPELLPVLKEVGVVDSGGAGLVRILEGMISGLNGTVIERKSISRIGIEQGKTANNDLIDSESGYCVEFVLALCEDDDKKRFVKDRFIKVMEGVGNTLKVDNDSEGIIKVHLHTLKPGVALNLAQSYGEFKEVKVENILEHHSSILKEEVKDTPRKEYAIISTSAGDGLAKLFSSLKVDYIVSGGQTMNPSTEDFVSAINKVHANKVFILPNNKNIIMAAEQAATVAEGCEVKVIPTKTIPQGLSSVIAFNSEESFNSNEQAMREAITQVKSGSITYAIRDTKIDDVVVHKDEFISLFDGKLVCSEKSLDESVKNLTSKMIDDDSCLITLIYGEGVEEKNAKALAEYLEDKYMLDVEVHNGGQPVYSYLISVE